MGELTGDTDTELLHDRGDAKWASIMGVLARRDSVSTTMQRKAELAAEGDTGRNVWCDGEGLAKATPPYVLHVIGEARMDCGVATGDGRCCGRKWWPLL
jgi:hypothetical protein